MTARLDAARNAYRFEGKASSRLKIQSQSSKAQEESPQTRILATMLLNQPYRAFFYFVLLLRGKICFVCSWLHSLKGWSLLKIRGDSKLSTSYLCIIAAAKQNDLIPSENPYGKMRFGKCFLYYRLKTRFSAYQNQLRSKLIQIR